MCLRGGEPSGDIGRVLTIVPRNLASRSDLSHFVYINKQLTIAVLILLLQYHFGGVLVFIFNKTEAEELNLVESWKTIEVTLFRMVRQHPWGHFCIASRRAVLDDAKRFAGGLFILRANGKEGGWKHDATYPQAGAKEV